MGRQRVYRQVVKERTSSAAAKTTFQGLIGMVKRHCEISLPEAQLLGGMLYDFYVDQCQERTEGQIIYPARWKEGHSNRSSPALREPIPVRLTVFHSFDVELWRESGGIRAVQAARIIRMTEEAYRQGGMLSIGDLSLLTATSAKTVRETLKPLWAMGVKLPIMGMVRRFREGMRVGWAELALERYLNGEDIDEIRQSLFISTSHWLAIYRRAKAEVLNREKGPYFSVWERANPGCRKGTMSGPKEELTVPAPSNFAELMTALRGWFGMSEIGAGLLLKEVEKWLEPSLGGQRGEGQVVYHAVADYEPPSKSLEECDLVPVTLSYLTDDDGVDFNQDAPKHLVWKRLLRLTTEAKQQGALLNQPDVAVITGSGPDLIRSLLQQNKEVFVPTRGNMADIGPGISHARKIIELYLQAYTVSEIVSRTHHSYESVENYLDRFCKVVGLNDEGLSVTEIRMVLGCSYRTVKQYLEMVKEFDGKEYRWMMAQIRMRYQSKKGGEPGRRCLPVKGRKGARNQFASLPRKNPEELQLRCLRERLELSERSLLGTKIITSFNQAMEEYEQTTDVQRLQPGDLVEEYAGQRVILPLWNDEAIGRLASGGSLSEHFSHVELEQYQCLRNKCPEATPHDLWSLTCKPPTGRKAANRVQKVDAMTRTETLENLDLATAEKVGALAKERTMSEHAKVPEPVKMQLLGELGEGLGMKASLLAAVLGILAGMRDWMMPAVDDLKAGQVMWLARSLKGHSKWNGRGRSLAMNYVPVALTHHTPQERPDPYTRPEEYFRTEVRRVARLTVEAWTQGAVLSTVDLALLMHRSTAHIRNLLDTFQRSKQLLLPTTGTVLDMGSTLTHKRIAVEWSLKGHNTTDIARAIFHTPQAVDNYLRTFNKVAILYVMGYPIHSIPWLLSCSKTLVNEHLSLARKHFPNREQLLQHLRHAGLGEHFIDTGT